MLIFNKDHKCPKCNCKKVSVRYISRSFIAAAGLSGTDFDQGDFIRRVCSDCGFSWKEAPLDKQYEN